MNTQATKQDLVITRVMNAPVEAVWGAWHDPQKVMEWWGPTHFTCPSAQIDFRVGGTSLVCMRAPKEFGGQDMYNTWRYTNIVPLQAFEYILHFSDENGNRLEPAALGLPPDMPSEMRNLVTFKKLSDNQTEITVTEYEWPVGEMMKMSEMGMNQCLDKMENLLKAGNS